MGAAAAPAVAGIFPTLLARLTPHVFTINMLVEVALDVVQIKRKQFVIALYLAAIRFTINIQPALSWVFDENFKLNIHFHLDRCDGDAACFFLQKLITSC